MREILLTFPKFSQAKCAVKGVDLDLHFPDTQKELQDRLPTLKARCGSCIHRIECSDFAINNKITDGFWGGYYFGDLLRASTPQETSTT